jgi:uncharacterized protein YdhG (YjbR/CyaY superfamily)
MCWCCSLQRGQRAASQRAVDVVVSASVWRRCGGGLAARQPKLADWIDTPTWDPRVPLPPLLNPTTGFGCAHNVRSMAAKQSRKRVASVREYIASKPKESRASLEAVRRAILKALPNAQEGLAYQMPVYTLNGVGVLYFAGWKSHYSLYPASDALVEAFAKELAPYERSKGTLKFPLSEPVPVRLIGRIARFRARQLTTRDAATGGRKGGREGQVDRIRRICAALPSAFEKMSHGTPCFFVEQGKGCFAMFSEHHRDDGQLSLWVPVADGLQPLMIEESPDIYFYPRYVGAGGWVGILLDQIVDDALESHLREARRIIASKRKPAPQGARHVGSARRTEHEPRRARTLGTSTEWQRTGGEGFGP